jgi:hypothetical protein
MTQRANPLMAPSQSVVQYDPATGEVIDYEGRKLQDTCDKLNSHANWRLNWRVVGTAPNRTIAPMGQIR